MNHLPELIQDLAIILMTAAIVTIVFRRLRQPVVLGYLIAGFLVGPHFPFMPSVQDSENISIWAEIGVIFMLFGLGLEFSIKKLKNVGKSATITACFEIFVMLAFGYITGRLLSWSTMDSLFLGGILSISSTTIIVRAFDELNLKGRNFVSLVFGVLVVEDVLAILLLVILSSVAVTQTLSGMELAYSSLQLGFFLVLCFVLGIYILPAFLRKFRKYLSDETILIVSIGLCLMMVLTASAAGFSPALGAFLMGSLLAETRDGHRIEQLLIPVKDLFSAVFFVSVGMLFDPRVLQDHFGVILLISLVTICGKFLSSTAGALISGRSLKNSVQVGMSLAQIGEFSFIIATLGVSLNVTSDFLYPVGVAVSAITTFCTPYLIRSADPFYFWLDKRIPKRIKEALAIYEKSLTATPGSNALSLIWKEYGTKIFLNLVVTAAIALAVKRLVLPRLESLFPDLLAFELAICFLTLFLVSPFLWAIFVGGPVRSQDYKSDILRQLKTLQFGVATTRILIGFATVAFIVSMFTSILAVSGVVLISLSFLGLIFFSRFSESIYQRIENHFLANLTENERSQLEKKEKFFQLAPWHATLNECVLSPRSGFVGKSLQDARLKDDYGVMVTIIERGDQRILPPLRHDVLMPFDRLFLLGTEAQLLKVRELLEVPFAATPEPLSDRFGLTSLRLSKSHVLVNKTIRDCGIREEAEGLIVGLEREGQRILNPDSSLTLQSEDLIWVVGDISKVRALTAH